jgi:hypothetical protein
MQKKLTAVAVASALALGGAAAVAVPALAATTPSPSATTPGAPAAPEDGEQRTDRTDRIKAALKGLVTDGTITQAQADKVAERLGQAGPALGAGRHFRGGPGGPGAGLIGPGDLDQALKVAAQSLGMSQDDVRAALEGGSTLAELAKKQGRSTDDLVTALVAAARERIAQAVKDGRITQQQADRITPNLQQRVRGAVENGRAGARGEFRGRMGGNRPGGAPDEAPSTASPGATNSGLSAPV